MKAVLSSRLAVFAGLVTLTLLLSIAPTAQTAAQTAPRRNARSATLQEQLEKGLKARRPEEFRFIDRVVKMVEQNRLPINLVRSTFDWARKKKPYQFPYFERALKIRAAKIGIIVK